MTTLAPYIDTKAVDNAALSENDVVDIETSVGGAHWYYFGRMTLGEARTRESTKSAIMYRAVPHDLNRATLEKLARTEALKPGRRMVFCLDQECQRKCQMLRYEMGEREPVIKTATCDRYGVTYELSVVQTSEGRRLKVTHPGQR